MIRARGWMWLLIGCLQLTGCLRWGYDPVAPREKDAGAKPYSGDSGALGSDAGFDAGMMNSGSTVDAGAPDADAGSDGNLRDAAADSGDDSDSSAPQSCPGALNACGGCQSLPAVPGSSCGACGLGINVCSGAEAIECVGGSVTPTTEQGTLLLDDFENEDRLFRAGPIHGDWYLVTDSTTGVLNPATNDGLVPVSPGNLGSHGALHVSGSGFSKWGAGVQASLNLEGCYVNAAAQSGATFYARGTGDVLFSVATRQTVPAADGGSCIGTCYDNFASTFTLTSVWKAYQMPWAMLRQGGWGPPVAFQPREVKYIQFSFEAGSSMDLYLDDVGFY